MPPLFDTCVFILPEYARAVGYVKDFRYSIVVAQELLVGYARAQHEPFLRQLNEYAERGRLVVPDQQDWCIVGKCLNTLWSDRRENLGQMSKDAVNLLVRDSLIARCAVKSGSFVVTDNVADFERIKRVMKQLKYDSAASFLVPDQGEAVQEAKTS